MTLRTAGRVQEFRPRLRIVRSQAHDCLSVTELVLVMTEVALDACKAAERPAGFVPRTDQRHSLAARLARMSHLAGASDELPPIDLGSARVDRTWVPCLQSFQSRVHSHLGQQYRLAAAFARCAGRQTLPPRLEGTLRERQAREESGGKLSRGGKLGRPSVAELGQPASLEPAVFGGKFGPGAVALAGEFGRSAWASHDADAWAAAKLTSAVRVQTFRRVTQAARTPKRRSQN
jgi:hypothetical protein